MRKINELLRLKFEQKLSNSKIANSLKVSETTIERWLSKIREAKITWPLSTEMDDQKLNDLLYPPREQRKKAPLPEFSYICKELKKKGVTLTGLWNEYRDLYPNGYGYTQFCRFYYDWCASSTLWMPQQHRAGESLFIDYAGLTVPIFDPQSKSTYNAQIFVSVLGASSYTYVEATKTQQLKDWIASHKRMFNFYGGVPEILIPDNLKSGVTKPDRYEPDLNPTYYEMAKHYGTAILPARSRKPKDKSKVENGVLNVERKLLAPIRNQKFFTLSELNQVLKTGLEKMNNTPFQKLPDASRSSLFLEVDKPKLRPLPESPYEFSYWKKATVNQGYHINIDNVFYSVPHTYVKDEVEIRYNERTVEVFCKGQQIALHMRSHKKGEYITLPLHQPLSHRKHSQCTVENIIKEASEIGENTKEWVTKVLDDSTLHMKQKKNICLGVVRLIKGYSSSRLERACKRGLYYENFSYKGIKGILEGNLDQEDLPIEEKASQTSLTHDNIRGPEYFERGLI